MSHLPGARLAMALVTLTALQLALGQGDRVTLVAGGVVRFELGPADVVAGAECPRCVAVAPVPGTGVVLEIERRNPSVVATIDVAAEGGTAAGSLALEARYAAFDATGATLWRTGWLGLAETPVAAFTLTRPRGNRDQVRVVPEYRLLPTGREAPGTHLVRVIYRERETGAYADHDLVITAPAYLSIRAVAINGAPVGSGVSFDLSRNPQAYVDAVVSRRPLPADNRGFARVEVATNAPGGYRITVALEELGSTTAGTAQLRDQVLLEGRPAHDRVFVTDRATDGYRILLEREDFTLALDGSEPTGTHHFVITFRGTAHP